MFARLLVSLALSLIWLVLCGCATPPPSTSGSRRPFIFQQDTFAYANELVWEYHFDPASGKTTHSRRMPPPAYTHHCFVVVRSAKQFFVHARFDASRPAADEDTYRRLIREVVSRSPRRESGEKVIIPGHTNLYAFSQAHEKALKEQCGGAWQSYFQRGHWRMVFPFSRAHQKQMADQLARSLRRNRPPVVHVVRFPSLSINHALVLFDVTATEQEIQFATYDPNDPTKPTKLTYDRAARTFYLPANAYFAGGRVDVYEIYHSTNY